MNWRGYSLAAAAGATAITAEALLDHPPSEEFASWRRVQEHAAGLLVAVGLRPVPGYSRVAPVRPEAPFLFGGSDCYYQARSRGVGLCFAAPQLFFCICPAPSTVRRQLARDVILILRPELRDPAAAELFVTACERLVRRLNVDLLIKNVPSSLVPGLLALGFRLYQGEECWSREEPADEETYPQVIWQPSRKAERFLPKITSLLEARHAIAQAGPPPAVELRHLYSRWRAWFLARHPQPDPSWMDRYYESALSSIRFNHLVVYVRHKHDSSLLGIAAAEPVSDYQLDGCTLLSVPGPWGGLLDRLLYLEAYRLGYRFVNTGGSETRSLYGFKLRLGNALLLESCHLIYPRNRHAMSNRQAMSGVP